MTEEVRYGEHPDQFIRVFAPQQSTTEVLTKLPVAVVVHGGFWRQKYNVDNALVDGFPSFFGARGWWTVNVEYRRGNAEVDGGAGGWPQTNQDILLALQALSESAESNSKFASMDMSRLVLLGHSAGGTLALWASSSQLSSVVDRESCFQSIKLPRPALCVPIAPIGNLVAGQLRRLSDDGIAIALYMKLEPELSHDGDVAEDSPYRLASPHFRFPPLCPTIFVTGEKDTDVPADLVVDSFHLASAAASDKDSLQLLNIPDADHYSLVTTTSSHWLQIFQTIESTMQAKGL